MPKVQIIHDGARNSPNVIQLYAHCALCIKERPSNMSPKEYSRTQAGYTEDGIQVWCNRHDVNVDRMIIKMVEDSDA